MSSNSDTPSESRPGGIGPGDRLQAARIEQGLSVEDIANKMHLSVGIVEAIEQNNFDDITAPIFVKGYLRAYARIVSLNEEEMIQQYVEFYSEEDPPITSTSSTSPEISSNDARVKWTTYIVILVLCGLLGAWWWSNNQKREDSISLDVDEPAMTEESTAESTINMEVEKNEDEIVAASETAVGAAEIDTESTNVESEALGETQVIVEADNDAETNSNNEQSEADNEPRQIDSEDNGVADSTADNSVADSTVETTVTVTGENSAETLDESTTGQNEILPADGDVIKLVIHADTWADIKDSQGNRLAYDLLRANREVILTGQAPFSVFFGNGHGVEMTYNNDPVDLVSHIRNDNTARLTIGTN